MLRYRKMLLMIAAVLLLISLSFVPAHAAGAPDIDVDASMGFDPDAPLTRAWMAVWLVRGMGEQPAASCTGMFGDVNATTVGDTFCRYIEKFATLGITSGCGNGNYCPNNGVTRAQIAIFLTKSLGSQAVTCTGMYSDVPLGYWACGFIEGASGLGITVGCDELSSPGLFCPDNFVTRAQMAAMAVRAFSDPAASYTQTPYFPDVPASHPFFGFVQQTIDSGIMSLDSSIFGRFFDFGAVTLGLSESHTFTISNSGDADLVVGEVTMNSSFDFFPYDHCSGKTVAPGSGCTFGVTFTPGSESVQASTATVSVPSNDPDKPVMRISLAGTGKKRFVISVAKTGDGNGSVTSSDGLINCGWDCSETYDVAPTITLQAVPDVDALFLGWSGCSQVTQEGLCVVSSCIGGICNVSSWVQAAFSKRTYSVDVSILGGHGGITCITPVDRGESSICTIAPDVGYHLSSLTDNGAKVGRLVSGNTYTITNVTADHTVEGRFAIDNLQITEYSIPNSGSSPVGIAAGPDGDIWFTEYGGDKIGRMTMSGKIVEYGGLTGQTPWGISPGPDGNIWFTERGVDECYAGGLGGECHHRDSMIGVISPAGIIREYAVGPYDGSCLYIAAGPDENLWFTTRGGHGWSICRGCLPPTSSEWYNIDNIGRITTSGSVSLYYVPEPPSGASGITAGPDGNVWFTATFNDKIGMITTEGVITEYDVPGGPYGITKGPDGNLWFTELGANKIGKITPSGSITEYQIPTPDSGTTHITGGPDGNLWFTEESANRIGKITPSGDITEYGVLSPDSGLGGITAGPDGNIWFTETEAKKIGKFVIPSCIDKISPARQIFSAGGGTGSLYVTSSSADCSWTALSTADWITLEPTDAGSGSGTVRWSVAPNVASGDDRTATIEIRDNLKTRKFIVVQLGETKSFIDLPHEYWAENFINSILFRGITSGCGNGNFCPEDKVTRAQMAVFVLKAIGMQPAAVCTGTVFGDVNESISGGEGFCRYVEKFAELGITAGCGGGNYCPDKPVTRAQMAVFLTKALNQLPSETCSGAMFGDVNSSSLNDTFCRYVEKFATLGITSGCGNGNYCPDSEVTRAQMAVFLTKGFLQ